jgi:uncharacterized metal-binding protein YceD (DUF177 family)
LKFTEIKISGLKEGKHSFHFDLDTRFLAEFSKEIFDKPVLSADVILHLTETMIRAELSLTGQVQLICDRSGDAFMFPVNQKITYFLKFGEKEEEISDELCTISKERTSIDFDQLVYDTVALSIPLKKLHPGFAESEKENTGDGKIVFSSSDPETENPEKEELADPRWQKLKDLIHK